MSASDYFGSQDFVYSQITRLAAITPNDTTDLTFITKAIWVGVAGNVCVIAKNDTASVIIPNVPVGWLDVRASRVLSTGTTATNLIAGA